MGQHLDHFKNDAQAHCNGITKYIVILSISCVCISILFLLLGYIIMKRAINGMVKHARRELLEDSTISTYSSKIVMLQPIISAFNYLIDINNQFKQKLMVAPVPIIELDKDYKIRFINTTGLNLLKMNKDDVLDKTCKEVIRSEKCQENHCPCRNATQSKNIISVETRIQIGDKDSKIPVEFTAAPYQTDKDNNGVILSIADLSMMGNIVDEVKRITEQLSMTSDTLSQMGLEIMQSTDDIVSMSEQSASSIASMATLGEEMSANVSSQADSVQKMTGSLKDVAKNTEKANQISKDANIKTTEVNMKMKALVDASEQIGKVITVINDIADRTDLLALNAAIEAEGAGIAGKGFAVVADEVQKLAKQSADATDEIAQEIENIQMSTQDAVQAMEKISTIIDEIAAINEKNASAVQEQTQTAARISEHTNQNVQASHTVANSASDALNLVNNISTKIKDTASQVESTNDVSQELAVVSSELMNIINQLNL
ncbi:MAG: Methyl-accepting chemotaxis sensory transducer with Pas/Pac sensor [Candidatus Magnetoglobus multicellularis str. Araruama]|uniref:Methyl-accepting chemotaxis sensory transducer with Pas/Pac sensor n=1 Tax=Candidatus Magnetoglobus multicellularis str. Araruama TaxID=890399 RepID=A0A1V1PIG8_9BACT|nr:MAG: Methyl-accepting chemotaxis sensory transducer with Pas/Pac sensor [Candidatus Magnetoglobus multicellularis str. Araruama]